LSSDHTFLPLGFSGDAAALAAALTAHAGQTDLSVPSYDAASDLGVNPRSNSLLFNLRQRFGEGFEAYLDALVLDNAGKSESRISSGFAIMTPASPANPFTNTITVNSPSPESDSYDVKKIDTARFSVGLLADLPFGWRGAADVSMGWVRYTTSVAYK